MMILEIKCLFFPIVKSKALGYQMNHTFWKGRNFTPANLTLQVLEVIYTSLSIVFLCFLAICVCTKVTLYHNFYLFFILTKNVNFMHLLIFLYTFACQVTIDFCLFFCICFFWLIYNYIWQENFHHSKNAVDKVHKAWEMSIDSVLFLFMNLLESQSYIQYMKDQCSYLFVCLFVCYLRQGFSV